MFRASHLHLQYFLEVADIRIVMQEFLVAGDELLCLLVRGHHNLHTDQRHHKVIACYTGKTYQTSLYEKFMIDKNFSQGIISHFNNTNEQGEQSSWGML